jgi:hypothetical protein
MKTTFLNKNLTLAWPGHNGYLKTIKKLRDLKEMIEKEEAVLGVENKTLFILSVNLTPYFYSTRSQRDVDYNKVMKLVG